jgi:hypothetical protein
MVLKKKEVYQRENLRRKRGKKKGPCAQLVSSGLRNKEAKCLNNEGPLDRLEH